ncbi:hypothetical protein MGWOODY_XGa2674 [hydrothermal vent metagenome]|uniref:Uncharacterized protein n=1 Tax=hydrothermal vent metagenome TaxID=652676 RepID=A0A170PRJ2_9ZZZZ
MQWYQKELPGVGLLIVSGDNAAASPLNPITADDVAIQTYVGPAG